MQKLKQLLIRLLGIRVAIAPKGTEIFIVPEGQYHLVKNRKKKGGR